MKKNICALAFILIFPVLFSCTGADKRSKEKKQENPSPVGGETDDHGCKTSAGYLWSVIKNKCIRLFEDGTKLNPLEATTDKTTAAYVVFSDDNNRAELFLPTGKPSIILERKAEGQPWISGEWMLMAWKGYVLKKSGVAVYGGT